MLELQCARGAEFVESLRVPAAERARRQPRGPGSGNLAGVRRVTGSEWGYLHRRPPKLRSDLAPASWVMIGTAGGSQPPVSFQIFLDRKPVQESC